MTAVEKAMVAELQKTVNWMKDEQLGDKLFLREAREQYKWYKQFVESATGKKVTINNWKVGFEGEEEPKQFLLVLWDDRRECWYDGFGDWYKKSERGFEVHIAGDTSVTWLDTDAECYRMLSEVRKPRED